MADLYIIRFAVGGEPMDAKCEFRVNAEALADVLADAEIVSDVKVFDDLAPAAPVIYDPTTDD
jgi:hypothetical protein